jgi:hypothetical protein
MAITLNGTTGIFAPAFDGSIDASDITGSVPSSSLNNIYNKGLEVLTAGTSIRWRNDTGINLVETKGTLTSIFAMYAPILQFGAVRVAVNITSAGSGVKVYKLSQGQAFNSVAFTGTLLQTWSTTGSQTLDVSVLPGDVVYVIGQAQNNTVTVTNVRLQTGGEDLWPMPVPPQYIFGFEGNRAP